MTYDPLRMAPGPGTRFGHYLITGTLGQGGMGTVYRATDSHLGRDVAIKILSDAFWNDPDRVARFEREARTLASLSHANVAIVHAIEDGPAGAGYGGRALVMELVDGATLAELIAKGPIPVNDALSIAKQIADGLEAAHDHGVVHRDLKPANVKVRTDGTVKVLDFGLAKSMEPVSVASSLSMSPTITTPAMTHAGVILGTASYMSPEQARGKPVDRRTDVWAFGCVLFEMLAGRRPFADEETVSDTLAGILKGEPVWAALPAETPPKIRSLLERCLRKDVRLRLPHIAQARIEIEEAASEPSLTAWPAAKTPGRRAYLWPAVAALSLLATAGLTGWMVLAPIREQPIVRFDVTAPPGAVPFPGFGRTIEIGDPLSPDGRTLAFHARVKGNQMIWVRPLDSPEMRPLPRTEGASRPYWSADGRSIAFFSQGQLKRIDLSGGPPTVICNEAGRDVAWSADDVILIGGQSNKPVLRVPALGGEPTAATELAAGETSHDYPQFLPDNRHFLYMARRGPNPEDWDMYVGRLDSKERHLLQGIHTAARVLADRSLVVHSRPEPDGPAFRSR